MQFAQIFSLLMALSGFGVDANPKAATADQVLEHSVDDADLVVHVDVAAVLPRNFKALTDLPNDPAIKQNRDLAQATRDVAAQATQARAMVKSMMGFDVVTDLQSVTMFAKFRPDGDQPDVLVEVRGTIPPNLLATIGKTIGATPDKNATTLALPDPKYTIGISKSGSVLVGTTAWVKARVADTWKPSARPAGSRMARLAAILDEKPFLAYAFQPSPTFQKMIEKNGKNAGTQMLADTDLLIGALRSDGLVWASYSKSAKGFDRAALSADGVIDLMRAFQIAPRGIAKIAVAYLDVYAGQSKEVDELIKHKDDILKIVDQFTGDGQFKAQIDKDPKAKSVVVHAIGKHLSEVLPAGLLIPAGAVVYLFTSARVMPPSTQMVPTPAGSAPAVPAKPVHRGSH
jgi:hypothetical protein